MRISLWFVLGAIYGVSSVIIGSFGSHAFKALLIANETESAYHIAKDYLGFHGLALMVLAMAIERWPQVSMNRPAVLLSAGAFIFSLSLLTFSLTGLRWVVHMAPVGGAVMIIGWLWLIVLSFRHAR